MAIQPNYPSKHAFLVSETLLLWYAIAEQHMFHEYNIRLTAVRMGVAIATCCNMRTRDSMRLFNAGVKK